MPGAIQKEKMALWSIVTR